MNPTLFLATLGPIGYAPFSGTVASIVAFFVLAPFRFLIGDFYYLFLIILVIIGYYVAVQALDYFKGRDPSVIVIDEVVGVAVALAFITVSLKTFFITLLFFRFFDGSKLTLRWAEKLPGVYGVMFDDILAGCYAGGIVAYSSYCGLL